MPSCDRRDRSPIAGSERGGARGNRSRPLCRRGGPRRPDRRCPASHRRRGRDVHLLPIRLGHGPDHGQGRPRRALGEHGREGIPARLRLDRQPLHRPARRTTSATARRPRSSSGCPSPRPSRCCPGIARSRASGARASATARSARIPASFLTSDCRGNLKRIQAEFEASDGPPPARRHRARDDVAQPEGGRHARTSAASTKPYCYHIDQFSELQPIIHKVIEYGQALGLDMIQGDHEDAPGQIELNFNFDRAEQHRRQPLDVPAGLPPGRARARTRSRASCRSRSWASRRTAATTTSRSGAATRTRSCRETDDQQLPSQIGLWAIGGILEHLGALTAVTALDRELVPAALGHGLLGAGLRRLGLPEPHDRAARLGARAASSTARSTRP